LKSADKAIKLATVATNHYTSDEDLILLALAPLTRGYESLLEAELNIINFAYARFDDNNNAIGFNASRWGTAPRQVKSASSPFILDIKYLELLEAYNTASNVLMKEKRRLMFLSIDLSKVSKPILDSMTVLDRLSEAFQLHERLQGHRQSSTLRPVPSSFYLLVQHRRNEET
jgi:hypothetical protein